ncbi:hypothetical protein [Pseudomonas sp. Seg1]|nr:hypothetical protein [Pseudomonas sp. Seg1]
MIKVNPLLREVIRAMFAIHDRLLSADSVEKVGFSADLNSGTTIA